MAELDHVLLRELGLAQGLRAEVIQQRHGHTLYRLQTSAGFVVLKLWREAEAANEIGNYRLLAELGVPTIRVITTTETALPLGTCITGRGDKGHA